MHLTRWSPAKDGPLSESALRRKMQRLGYRATQYVYPPGTRFPEHTHAVEKMDAVLSGRFRMTMEGREMVLEAGDLLEIPAGTRHAAEVVGDEPVVSLDGVKS